MNNKTTTKTNPVNPNISSELNFAHQGICQTSEVVQTICTGDCWFGSHLKKQSQSGNKIKTESYSKNAGYKPAQIIIIMKNNIKTNGAAASNGNNNSNVVRKAFTGFTKPQILTEGEHPAVIASMEQLTGTDGNNEPVDLIEITVSVSGDGKSHTLKRSYNMSENGRGAAQMINDYNTLFNTNHNRNELYKLECERLINLPVVVSIVHNNATKVPTPVIKALKPVSQPQPEVVAEAAPLAA